ncbi:hypothetical protein [Bacillus cereus]|uniref:hypothetical protein n=1 Tax=Bacillus cereus TaxID=1396 RepID=UPI00065BBE7F|nr:hypothetical protein [Bacillus cereus]KMQ26047.1 hypothetical protein TU58_16995 [Bacillus cereus]
MVDLLGSSIVQGVSNNAVRWKMYRSRVMESVYLFLVLQSGGSEWNWNKAFRIKPDETIKEAIYTRRLTS